MSSRISKCNSPQISSIFDLCPDTVTTWKHLTHLKDSLGGGEGGRVEEVKRWGWGGRVGILSLLRLFRVTGFIAHHIFSYNTISATHDKLAHALPQIPLALLSTAMKTSPVFLCIPKYVCIVSRFWICWNGLETETLITCLVGDNVINSLCQSNWSPAVMLSQLLCGSNKF